MELRKIKFFNIFLVIINLMVVLKLLKESFKIDGFNYIFIVLMIVIGVFIYIIFSQLINERRSLLVFISIIFLFGLILSNILDRVMLEKITLIYENLLIINSYALNNKDTSFSMFKDIFSITIPLLVFLSICITMIWNKFPIIFSSSVFIGVWYSILYDNVIVNLPYYIVVFVVSLGISYYMNQLKKYHKRNVKIDINNKIIIGVIALIAIILSIIIKILPQNLNGKNFDETMNILKNKFSVSNDTVIEENYISDAIKNRFTMKQSGYSDSNVSLGGPIIINTKGVFTVKADKPYYLKARVNDTYLGDRWTSIEKDINQQFENNFKNSTGMSYLYDALDENNDLMNIKPFEDSIVITPNKDFKSGSFFTPNGAFKIEGVNDKIYFDNIPIFMSNSYIRDSYKVKFVSYGDYDNYLNGIENEEYMLKSSLYEYVLPVRKYGQTDIDYYNYIDSIINDTNEHDLIKKYSKIKLTYMNYMQVPEGVSEDVYKLVEKILQEEADSQGVSAKEVSTHKKALAIRNYLKNNYKYSTMVERGSGNKDFVTNFLINEKKGYCTYFATANTIMCRIAGIPARFSEGFKLNKNKMIGDEYLVTNEEAHAWTEILVNPLNDIWAISDGTADEVYIKEDSQEALLPQNNNVNNNIQNVEDVIYSDDGNDVNYSKAVESIPIIFLVVISLLSTILVFIVIFIIRKNKALKSYSIIPFYHYILYRLKTIGIKKQDNQGDLEFAKNIEDEELRNKLIYIVNIVYEEFYGGETYDKINRKETLNYFENYIKKSSKNVKYIINKYFIIR